MPCTFTAIDIRERAREQARQRELSRLREEERKRREEELRQQEIARKKRALIVALDTLGYEVEETDIGDGKTLIEGSKKAD